MITQSIVGDFEEQVLNCKHLLSIFQSERQMYHESDLINIKSIMSMLKEKKALIDNFCSWEEQLFNHNVDIFNAEVVKNWVSELKGIFEQLLIIDTENEILLKKRLNKSSNTKKETLKSKISNTKTRPFIFKKTPQQQKPDKPANVQMKNYRNIKEYLKLNTANIKACAK